MVSVRKKRPLRMAVVLDPIAQLTFERDSSVLLMAEACARGHDVFYFTATDLQCRRGNLSANMQRAQAFKQSPYLQSLGQSVEPLASMDLILIRKDPPFDAGYLYLTQLLDLLPPDVLCLNSPQGLRNANEKLFILNFPQWIAPTLVTCSLTQARHFFKEQKSKVIIKPLNLFSGLGIEQALSAAQLTEKFERMTQSGSIPVMLQRMLRIERGDKRVNVINGRAIGTLLRLPKSGEYRSNLMFGGKAVQTTITKHDHAVVETIAPRLKKEGLFFAGLDLIDGYLTEINVTSPTGYPSMNRLCGIKLESIALDAIEKKLK